MNTHYYIVPLAEDSVSTAKANCHRGVQTFRKLLQATFLLPSGKDDQNSPSRLGEMRSHLNSMGIQNNAIMLPINYIDVTVDAGSAFGLRGQLYSLLKVVASQAQRSSVTLEQEKFHLKIICSWQQYFRAKFICWIHTKQEVSVSFVWNRKIGNIFYFFTELKLLRKEIHVYCKEIVFRRNNLCCSFCGHRSVVLPSFTRKTNAMQANFSTCKDCACPRIGVFGKSKGSHTQTATT